MSTSPRRKKPNVLSIPTGISFAEALAAELSRLAGRDPLKLSEMTVLLPNRRACRTLQALGKLTAGLVPITHRA